MVGVAGAEGCGCRGGDNLRPGGARRSLKGFRVFKRPQNLQNIYTNLNIGMTSGLGALQGFRGATLGLGRAQHAPPPPHTPPYTHTHTHPALQPPMPTAACPPPASPASLAHLRLAVQLASEQRNLQVLAMDKARMEGMYQSCQQQMHTVQASVEDLQKQVCVCGGGNGGGGAWRACTRAASRCTRCRHLRRTC